MDEDVINNSSVIDLLKQRSEIETANYLASLSSCANKNIDSLRTKLRRTKKKHDQLKQNSSRERGKIELDKFLNLPFAFTPVSEDVLSNRLAR